MNELFRHQDSGRTSFWNLIFLPIILVYPKQIVLIPFNTGFFEVRNKKYKTNLRNVKILVYWRNAKKRNAITHFSVLRL